MDKTIFLFIHNKYVALIFLYMWLIIQVGIKKHSIQIYLISNVFSTKNVQSINLPKQNYMFFFGSVSKLFI
jgi:hypothetical protein